ncbi:MAG: hypothetical protein JSV33_13075 [bacterium]|nr:MAG: hypothetical protein JSV33_13075 [bacterium]
MRRMRMSLLSLMALALLVGPGIVQGAEGGVRFNATIHTPNVRVRIGNTPTGYYYRGRHLPIRRHHYYRIRQRDRAIAHRLAWYTGVPARELIRLRRSSYSWMEIGHWLYLPRRVVRAALNQRSWKRFLLEERLARCGGYRQGLRRVICLYDDR